MRSVTMIVNLSGGGPGGRDWRDFPAGATLDVEDWEAEDLIRIGLAVAGPEGGAGGSAPPAPEAEAPADESEPGAGAPADDGTGVSPLAQVSPLAETAGTAAGATDIEPEPPAPAPEPESAAPEPEQLPDEAPVPPPLAPAPHQNKQAWIDWAISQGADPDTANAMTKADLMSRYGGRL
jgi:hypothetical protein